MTGVPTPEQLQRQADDLRELARQARARATSLATHLDAARHAAEDDRLWKGPYPSAVATTLAAQVAGLTRAADLLRADATAWDNHAATLDSDAADLRREQHKEAG